MTRHSCLGIAGIALFALSTSTGLAGGAARFQSQPETPAASAAAQASPELVGALAKELGATPEQAAGAAGTLFGVAKSRLKAEEFSQVAKAVPGMDSLLRAAPSMAGAVGTSGALSQLGASGAGLAGAAAAFSKLGLKPEMVSKAVPALTSFLTKTAGADVANLLASVLK
jgi:uncharacterized protein VcgC/VcgE DUF2780